MLTVLPAGIIVFLLIWQWISKTGQKIAAKPRWWEWLVAIFVVDLIGAAAHFPITIFVASRNDPALDKDTATVLTMVIMAAVSVPCAKWLKHRAIKRQKSTPGTPDLPVSNLKKWIDMRYTLAAISIAAAFIAHELIDQKKEVWLRQSYCATSGREFLKEIMAREERTYSRGDKNGVFHNDTMLATWNYCEAQKTCLLFYRNVSTVIAPAETGLSRHGSTLGVFDLITNERLFAESIDQSNSDESERKIKAQISEKYPRCEPRKWP